MSGAADNKRSRAERFRWLAHALSDRQMARHLPRIAEDLEREADEMDQRAAHRSSQKGDDTGAA